MPPQHHKSYLHHVRNKKVSEDNKHNVADALGKFLDDCEDDDLLLSAVADKKSRSSRPKDKIAMSEHRGAHRKPRSSRGSGLSKSTHSNSPSRSPPRSPGKPSSSSSSRRSPNRPSRKTASSTTTSSSPRKPSRKQSSRKERAREHEDSSTSVSSIGDDSFGNDDGGSFGEDEEEVASEVPLKPSSGRHKENSKGRSAPKERGVRRARSTDSANFFGDDDGDASAAPSSRRLLRRTASVRHTKSNDVAEPSRRETRPGSSRSGGRSEPPRRRAPGRSVSDISGMVGGGKKGSLDAHMASLERQHRREDFKNQYRGGADDLESVTGGRSVRSSRNVTRSSSFYGGGRGGGDSDDRSVSSSASQLRRGGKSSGLDGGPLSAFLGGIEVKKKRGGSGASVVNVPRLDDEEKEVDEDFVRDRGSHIDNILNQAKNEREEEIARLEEEARLAELENLSDSEDDEALPTMQKIKKKGVKYLMKKGVKVTRSTAKGSVNAVRDPKRAAKNVGKLTKDVAKGSVNAVLDPKAAAKKATKLTTKGIKGTMDIGKDVTTGIAKGGFKVTKTVAKGGLGATTKVVGKTTDGLGKVVTGATGLVYKRSSMKEEDDDEYDASNMACRQRTQTSLLDRLGSDYSERSDEMKKPATLSSAPGSSLLVPEAVFSSTESKGAFDL